MRTKRLRQNMILAERALRQVEAEEEIGERLDRMRRDLSHRGVSPELSEQIAVQLCARTRMDAMSPEEYDALIDGAVLACGAREEIAFDGATDADAEAENAGKVREIERMMQAFAGELQKLDESLEVLSAYVRRMRTEPSRKPPSVPKPRSGDQTLH